MRDLLYIHIYLHMNIFYIHIYIQLIIASPFINVHSFYIPSELFSGIVYAEIGRGFFYKKFLSSVIQDEVY